MKHFKKVVACVLRDLNTSPKMLVFEHPPPLSDYQIPKGTVEEGEDLLEAVLRELAEESGLKKVHLVNKIDQFEIICPGGPNGNEALERQSWHVYHLKLLEKTKDHWSHQVSGEGVDRGLLYRYFWHDLNGSMGKFHPKFQRLIQSVQAYLEAI